MKKSLIAIVIIVLIVAFVAFWKFYERPGMGDITDQQQSDETITGSFPATDDTTESINNDANSINVSGEFGADLKSLDGDISSF